MHMDDDDMKNIYNEWRAHPEEWMHSAAKEEYTQMIRAGQNQKAHHLAKSRFKTYLFHRCKFLLHKLIELPIVNLVLSDSVEQPVSEVLTDIINSLEEHKTPEYQEAVQRSEKLQEGRMRLTHKLWWAQYNYTKGPSLQVGDLDGSLNFYDLNAEEQELVEASDTRRSANVLDGSLKQKRPLYRGEGAECGRQMS